MKLPDKTLVLFLTLLVPGQCQEALYKLSTNADPAWWTQANYQSVSAIAYVMPLAVQFIKTVRMIESTVA